ncbi:MAG: nucleotidyltransferase domain-containing protein [Brevinematales bacterium]
MRLSLSEQNEIKRVIEKFFGSDCNIYIFGSRVYDDKKGGDIDIFVETNLDTKEMVRAKIKALVELENILGERKIDLVIKNPFIPEDLIHKLAKEEGVKIN